METDDQGNVVRYYIYGLGLIGSQDTSGGYSLHHYNRRGDTIALTDLNGQVTDRMVYDPYGAVISRIGTTQTPYLFDGRDGVATDDNGLVHMRARYYNPQTGGFISQDTLLGSITHAKSLNRYAYAEGNPLLYNDPTGHFINIAIGTAIGATVGGISSYIASDGDWNAVKAGAIGGAISGAIVSTGAGAVTLAVGAGTLNTAGAVGAMGVIGAVGSATGNIGNQVSEDRFNGQEVSIDTKEVALSAAVGGIAGAASGGFIGLEKAVKASAKAINANLSNAMQQASTYLTQTQKASPAVVQKVQSAYMSGMTKVGLSTNRTIVGATAIDQFLSPIISEKVNYNLKGSYKYQ